MSGSVSRASACRALLIDATRLAVTADLGALTLSIRCRAVSACSLGSSVSPVSLVPDLRTSHPAFTQSLQYAWGVFGSSKVPRSTAKSSAMSW